MTILGPLRRSVHPSSQRSSRAPRMRAGASALLCTALVTAGLSLALATSASAMRTGIAPDEPHEVPCVEQNVPNPKIPNSHSDPICEQINSVPSNFGYNFTLGARDRQGNGSLNLNICPVVPPHSNGCPGESGWKPIWYYFTGMFGGGGTPGYEIYSPNLFNGDEYFGWATWTFHDVPAGVEEGVVVGTEDCKRWDLNSSWISTDSIRVGALAGPSRNPPAWIPRQLPGGGCSSAGNNNEAFLGQIYSGSGGTITVRMQWDVKYTFFGSAYGRNQFARIFRVSGPPAPTSSSSSPASAQDGRRTPSRVAYSRSRPLVGLAPRVAKPALVYGTGSHGTSGSRGTSHPTSTTVPSRLLHHRYS